MNKNIIWDVFEAQVNAQPEHPAIIEEHKTLTYAQLAAYADAIAETLPAGVRRAAIIADHGAKMIAAMLAVLKTGAAYIPIEPNVPKKRIAFMLAESGADCLITEPRYAFLQDRVPVILLNSAVATAAAPAPCRATPESLAYILYTSGSTGRPKGVAVTNANVCHYARAFYHEFDNGPQDIMLQYSVCSFDIFVEEVFASLLNGAALAVPSRAVHDDLSALMRFVAREHVTIISGFPYLLQEMNALERILQSLRLLISGGDVLRAAYVDRLLPQVTVYNTYGPSETTVCASYFKCTPESALEDGTFPIGKPVAETDIKILDADLNPVAPGESGEICIFGEGVSDGYIGGRKENAMFTEFEGRRMYRSGDLGYTLPDGNIAFTRRRDEQVMILGKRVEPEEVENVLYTHPAVRQAAVRAFADEDGLSYLTAYVVTDDKNLTRSELAEHLSAYLMPFMIPEFFVKLEKLPLTPNGKVDGAALPKVLK